MQKSVLKGMSVRELTLLKILILLLSKLTGMKMSHSYRKIVEILLTKQSGYSNFKVLLEKASRAPFFLTLIWMSKSRTTFKYFRDIIAFDITYLTNKYDMPFAPFIRANHHEFMIDLFC